MTTRRRVVTGAALLAAGGAGLWLARDHLPLPVTGVRFANGQGTPWAAMPDRRGLIEVAVTVNGTPARALVDSGAQFSAIDAGLSARLGLPKVITPPIIAYGVSGQAHASHAVSLDLALSGLAVPGLRAVVLDLAGVSAASGREFQVLIGRDVLRHLVVEADHPRSRVRFLPPAAYRAPRDAVVVPLHAARSGPVAAVRIEAAPPVGVLVDTGSGGLLALSQDAARTAGLLDRPGGRALPSIGLSGLRMDRSVRAAVVRIGGVTLRDVDIQVFPAAKAGAAPAGLLGAAFFRRYRMALDLSGGRLVLARSGLMVVPSPLEPRP